MPEKKTPAKATTTRTTRRSTAAARPRRAPSRRAAPKEAGPKPAPAWRKTRRRTLVGSVVSDKTPKTVTVLVIRLRQHPLYKKVIRVRKRIPAHDANEEAKLGDIVRIEESRPFSATKRFRVVQVVSRAGEAREAAPRVAEVEAALEEVERLAEVLPTRGPSTVEPTVAETPEKGEA